LAALNGHPGAVAFLVRHGADYRAKDNQGMTALHKAIAQGYEEVVSQLLELGADPNLTSPVRDGSWVHGHEVHGF
jgi:uncharacterized protein